MCAAAVWPPRWLYFALVIYYHCRAATSYVYCHCCVQRPVYTVIAVCNGLCILSLLCAAACVYCHCEKRRKARRGNLAFLASPISPVKGAVAIGD